MKKPDIRDRINRTNAYNVERKSREYERIQEALAVRQEQEKLQEWTENFRFDLALAAFEIVRMLEKQRDDNVPKNPDYEWNELFCNAIKALPEAKEFAQDCWYECVKVEE